LLLSSYCKRTPQLGQTLAFACAKRRIRGDIPTILQLSQCSRRKVL
jgi:hypothetical protein